MLKCGIGTAVLYNVITVTAIGFTVVIGDLQNGTSTKSRVVLTMVSKDMVWSISQIVSELLDITCLLCMLTATHAPTVRSKTVQNSPRTVTPFFGDDAIPLHNY